MKVKVLYFAQIAEITGKSSEEIILESGNTSTDLIEILKNKYPAIGKQKYKLAVNQTLAQKEKVLKDNEEVALLPPFAGG